MRRKNGFGNTWIAHEDMWHEGPRAEEDTYRRAQQTPWPQVQARCAPQPAARRLAMQGACAMRHGLLLPQTQWG